MCCAYNYATLAIFNLQGTRKTIYFNNCTITLVCCVAVRCVYSVQHIYSVCTSYTMHCVCAVLCNFQVYCTTYISKMQVVILYNKHYYFVPLFCTLCTSSNTAYVLRFLYCCVRMYCAVVRTSVRKALCACFTLCVVCLYYCKRKRVGQRADQAQKRNTIYSVYSVTKTQDLVNTRCSRSTAV